MPKIKNETIKALEGLDASELLLVYDMILNLKKGRREYDARTHEKQPPYKQVREALRSCPGQLSNDVISSRKDRI